MQIDEKKNKSSEVARVEDFDGNKTRLKGAITMAGTMG
jgi:hypothetical protein